MVIISKLAPGQFLFSKEGDRVNKAIVLSGGLDSA